MSSGRDQTTTQISNPYAGLPKFVENYYRDDIRRTENQYPALNEIRNDMIRNPREIVGISDEETMALENIMGASDNLSLNLDEARGMISGEDFMSGYTDDVVDTTLAGLQRQFDRDRVARGASQAAIGGLSGSRAGVADAVAESLHGLNMSQVEAQLRDNAYRFGVGAGGNAASMLAGLADQEFQGDLTETSTMGAYGALGRDLAQQEADVEYTRRADPWNWYNSQFDTIRDLPGTGGGTTTQQQPGPSAASQLLGGAATAAGIWSMLSDERAKEEIEEHSDALSLLRDIPAYTYRYRDGLGHTKSRTAGLMAQDLEVIEGAVSEREDGYKVVDPYPVLATVVQAVRELDARTREAA